MDEVTDIGLDLVSRLEASIGGRVIYKIRTKVLDARNDPDMARRRWPFELIQNAHDAGAREEQEPRIRQEALGRCRLCRRGACGRAGRGLPLCRPRHHARAARRPRRLSRLMARCAQERQARHLNLRRACAEGRGLHAWAASAHDPHSCLPATCRSRSARHKAVRRRVRRPLPLTRPAFSKFESYQAALSSL